MKLQKQNVEVWVMCKDTIPTEDIQYYVKYAYFDKEILYPAQIKDLIENGWENIGWLKPIKDVYILTETELETLKQESYGIGVRDGQNSK